MKNWFKKQVVQKTINPKFKTWDSFTDRELKIIASMLNQGSYGYVTLNMNDVFAPAAWSVDCDQFDLLVVAELYQEFGSCGVVAWCAVKEHVEKTFKGSYPNFKKAKEQIENNLEYYFWEKRIKGVTHES